MLLWYKVVILSHSLNQKKTIFARKKIIDMKRILFAIFLLSIISLGNQLKSQISSGGIPFSFTDGNVTDYYQEIALTVPSPDELYGDGENEDKLNLPHRFAKLIDHISLTRYFPLNRLGLPFFHSALAGQSIHP